MLDFSSLSEFLVGTPVLMLGDELIVGFDRERIDALLGARRNQS